MDFVRANFSHDQIYKILALYPIEIDEVRISDLSGVANDNYRVTGKSFDLAIKVYSHGQSDRRKIEKELEVLQVFGRQGILVPKLVQGRNKRVLQELDGFNVVATEFIRGKVFDQLEFNQKRMHEVGKIVAQVEFASNQIDIGNIECMNFREEFDDVSNNLEAEIARRRYSFDLGLYYKNFDLVQKIIQKIDDSRVKQFLHKDIWPWNLIEASEGVYLIDFNDWSIGNPIIELSVALLEFGMFKSDKFSEKRIKIGWYSTKKIWYINPWFFG